MPSPEAWSAYDRRRRLDDKAAYSACYAPATTLNLDPLGTVRACCYGPWNVLGRIGRTGLLEIWRGEAVEDLRRRLAVRDLSGGCDACAHQVATDPTGSVDATVFDQFPVPDTAPAWPAQLELALSNACNLQCVMCSGTFSSAIRSQRDGLPPLPKVYDDAFFADLAEFLPHLRKVAFLGGEPFLAAETYRVVDLLAAAGTTPDCVVTTNATVWGDRVERLLDQVRPDVVVSLDAVDPEVARRVRVGVDPDAVLDHLRRFRDRAAAAGTGLSLAHCPMTVNWRELHGVLALADDLDVDVVLNHVDDPPHLSLDELAPAELAEVVAGLDAQAARAPLGRNAAVFAHHRDRLAALAARPAVAASASASGSTAAVPVPDPVRGLPDEDDLAGEGVVRFEVDLAQRLRAVHPDAADVFGLDLRDLLGAPLGEWLPRFFDEYGTLESSATVAPGGGLEERRVRVRGPRGTHELRADFRPGRDGGTWWVRLDRVG